jgi:hypothetical protein
MTPDLRQRLRRLLLGLPYWEAEEGRRELCNTVWNGHAINLDLDKKGSAKAVVDRLLDLEETHGWEPFRALLAGLRQRESTHPHRCREIDAIDELLRQRGHRHRQSWSGEPYRGLLHFDKRHAPIFFGREAETESLIRTISGTEQGGRFCIVIGASGSGKSSLVRAGLWARLEAGSIEAIPGSQHWLIHATTPAQYGTPEQSLRFSLQQALSNNDRLEAKLSLLPQGDLPPLDELAEVLLDHDRDARWLLILDQMEGLFSACPRATAEAFLHRLISATGPPSRFQVLATLRSDFYPHCLDFPSLVTILGNHGGTVPLAKPDRLAMERMVSGPLQELELPDPWILDPELPPAIAIDAERQPGGLALMAFALQELYIRCQLDRRMDLAAYRSPEFGGLNGVIARRADQTLASLGAQAEQALNRVFIRLVRVPKGEEPTRQRAPLAIWQDDADARQLLDAFIKARLLTTDSGDKEEDPAVEVAHEALLREWPHLADWIEQHRKAFALADRVRAEAHSCGEGERPWRPEIIDEFRAELEHSGILEQLLEDKAVARLLTPEVDWIIAELHSVSTSPKRRSDIGIRLAEIGDPRPGIGVVDGIPDILWREVPGGGVELADGHGIWPVTRFCIAAYPITFAQFCAFLDADDGWVDAHWWRDIAKSDHDSIWRNGITNRPVSDVSWYDATAFCRWLGGRLGLEVRLPFEHEWQWAAQSAQPQFNYPWGEEWVVGRANTSEAQVRRTTAVGTFPHGNSHQCVSDLAGNVWEWCANEYHVPTRTHPTGTEPRVLRGGSWVCDATFSRATCRRSSHPNVRTRFVGFRPVYSSLIR